MGMLLDAMLWLAVVVSSAAGLLAIVAINGKRKQMLLIRGALHAAQREGGRVEEAGPVRPARRPGTEIERFGSGSR